MYCVCYIDVYMYIYMCMHVYIYLYMSVYIEDESYGRVAYFARCKAASTP